MKVGIFSPYFATTIGGGERYVLTVAEFFLKRGDQVDIFWTGDHNVADIKEKFNLDLAGVHFRPDVFFNKTNRFNKVVVTAAYDLMFFLSDGSIPLSFARKNILHFQTPFHYDNQRTLTNKLKLARFQSVVCNSAFTKSFIDKTYGINSKILYPPVDVAKFSVGKKEKLIVSVGHIYGHIRPKCQDIMIKTFTAMVKEKKLAGWKLALIGSVHNDSEDELVMLKRLAKGYPVEIITDGPFRVVKDYLSRAAIYWHAAGFGVDLEKEPEKAEHFGMSTVEAMAAGAVPVVFNGGGQREVVNDGVDGFFWNTTDELCDRTLQLVNNPKRCHALAKQAEEKSKTFSKEKFYAALEKIF
ncbi:MAG: glycosyltransferase [Patescibacteria group bacterium]|nr:glycosyltransferase [Patescibacteria group bacterium]MCL5431553.1 glycosyltransferase [Patescibacteria group bacterium]